MSKRVNKEIINNIKSSKYYSISVDSTTDFSHADQICLAVRYIEDNRPENDISLSDCRGQSYDNAAVMSGCKQGLQALVKKENPLALRVPCFGHSLNLVGTAVMTCSENMETKKFFDFLENIHVFFSGSSERYKLLLTKLEENVAGTADRLLVPKRRIQVTSLEIQKKESDLNTSIALFKSLRNFISCLRDDFIKYKTKAKNLLGYYGKSQETEFELAEKFRIECYLPIIDKLVQSLDERLSAYREIESYFGFLRNLHTISAQELEERAQKLLELYPDDIDNNITSELLQFREFSKQFINIKDEQEKNKDRLNDLTLLAMENEMLSKLSFDDIINDFEERKARKVLI
ncbi:hypothetical protein TKK_0015416 [Trichogramma kaykai]